MRIVSLVPSVTELVCDLGLADQLVGRTGFCIHPWEIVRHVPKVGGTKDLRMDRIRELAPTHVIVNVDENRREDAEALAEFVPEVVVTHPVDPRDNLALYRQLGEVFDRREAAEGLCRAFEAALEDVRPVAPERVLYLIWRDPWMTVSRDTYISRTLALFGWETVAPGGGDRYPEVVPEALTGIDRVLLSSEPFHFKPQHVDELSALIPAARIALIDGEMTSWYGSRAIRGLRYLTEYVSGR